MPYLVRCDSVTVLKAAGRSPQLWKKDALQQPQFLYEIYPRMKKVYKYNFSDSVTHFFPEPDFPGG